MEASRPACVASTCRRSRGRPFLETKALPRPFPGAPILVGDILEDFHSSCTLLE